MIDHTFTEVFKPSKSGLYDARLFRLPDADDGSIRLSIEVKRHNGPVFFHLADTYWMGTNELLDWDAQQDILFWTCNGQKHAFIFDVAHTTLVSADAELGERGRLDWDDDMRCWMKFNYLYTVKVPEETDEDPTPFRQRPGDYYEKTILLKLPYDDPSSTGYKLIPTNDKRFVVVLKPAKKKYPVEPPLWEMGIVDVQNYTWVIKSLPYYVGEDTVRANGQVMQCYGYDSSHTSCYIFRIDLDVIVQEKKVEVFIHDFDPSRPERFVWDEEDSTWRAVVNGKIVYPAPFYFDNMYAQNYPIDGTRVPAEVLDLLPKNDTVTQLITEEKTKQKMKIREVFEQNNTSLDQLSRRSFWKSLDKQSVGWGIAILVLILIILALVFLL